MSDPPPTTDLTLERLNRLGREFDALREVIRSLTGMLALQLGDIATRLDRTDRRLESVEQIVRGYASEQLSLANQIVGAQQEASRAHQRLDEQQGDAP